jgi:hypothetical protein
MFVPRQVGVMLLWPSPSSKSEQRSPNRQAISNQSAKAAIHSRCLSPQTRQLKRRDARTDGEARTARGLQ